MYLSKLIIENFRCFGEGNSRFEMTLEPGLTALVGENDLGKTAVIDALRFALGTSDQEWNRLEDSDFHVNASSREIRIVCKFQKLSGRDQRAFLEYLTYDNDANNEPVLYVNWTAKDTGEIRRGRSYRRTEVRSGKEADGPQFDTNARDLLRATYLRPLRDAEQALSAGRGSRLAQILQSSRMIKEGEEHDKDQPLTVSNHKLSILGIAKLIDELLREQKAVKMTREQVNTQLKELALSADRIESIIKISGSDAADDIRIRQMLEKLDLALAGDGKPGLGSNNLLFMASELLLLAEDECNKLLLIEEPEAHLHAQRQLRAMKFLQDQAKSKGVQVIVTTHSPNLASAIDLNNIVMIHNRRAFSMASGQTALEPSDYRFLQRFLDVTKANLFFARAVVIVEGDAENILLPTLSRLIGRDFTEHGVSIVNVGGVGLRRYARIFQRKDTVAAGELNIPVACVTDMDVMPDCAAAILGKVKEGDQWPDTSIRRWRAKRDFDNENTLEQHRAGIEAKASGQKVKTFVSDEWTLEYDLVLGPKNSGGVFTGGLAEEVFMAACLSAEDDALNTEAKDQSEVESSARTEFADLKRNATARDGCAAEEVLASLVYSRFARDRVSKPIAAQYFAEILQKQVDEGNLTSQQLRNRLPTYLLRAIEYVTRDFSTEEQLPTQGM
ncbi:MAG: AAA family ATPase [Nitrospiraceae bacterium]|nr:AAA family ATPase [Nitrospiraceae bacterium]